MGTTTPVTVAEEAVDTSPIRAPPGGEGRAGHHQVFLFLIVAAGLALRLWGIDWGLPDRTELHPDEHDYVLKYALKIDWQHPDPVFLNYPSFLFYLISLTFGALRHWGVLDGQDWQAYLIGRCWSAFFSAATVLPIYGLARELGGSKRAGLLSALWMAILPLSVWEAHVAVTDSMMTFWVIMTLWASTRLPRADYWRDFAMAGAFLGLATGSKYTAALTCVAIVVGAFARSRPLTSTLLRLGFAAVVALACAFVVMPFSFIRFGDLLRAMAYEHSHTMSNHFGFSIPAAGPQYRRYVYQLFAAWPFSLGFSLYAVAAAGSLWFACKRDKRTWPVMAFVLLFFGVTGSWSFVPLRYYLPLVAVGTLCAGLWLDALLDSPRTRGLGTVITLATLAYTGIFTVQTTARYANETRVAAGQWMERHLPAGTRIHCCGWTRYMGLPKDRSRLQLLYNKREATLEKPSELTPGDVLQITSLHFGRQYRQGNTYFINVYNRMRQPCTEFEPLEKFESTFINKHLYMKLDPMYEGYFVSPTIEFYRLLKPITRRQLGDMD